MNEIHVACCGNKRTLRIWKNINSWPAPKGLSNPVVKNSVPDLSIRQAREVILLWDLRHKGAKNAMKTRASLWFMFLSQEHGKACDKMLVSNSRSPKWQLSILVCICFLYPMLLSDPSFCVRIGPMFAQIYTILSTSQPNRTPRLCRFKYSKRSLIGRQVTDFAVNLSLKLYKVWKEAYNRSTRRRISS